MKSIPIEVSQKGMDEERKESKNRKRDTLVNRCLPPARRIRRLTAEATDIREKVKISPSIRFVSQNSKQVGTRSMTCGEKHFAMEKRTCFSHCSCYSEKELTVEWQLSFLACQPSLPLTNQHLHLSLIFFSIYNINVLFFFLYTMQQHIQQSRKISFFFFLSGRIFKRISNQQVNKSIEKTRCSLYKKKTRREVGGFQKTSRLLVLKPLLTLLACVAGVGMVIECRMNSSAMSRSMPV